MEDLNYTGAVRYGDKVWLQIGRHELLGASPAKDKRQEKETGKGGSKTSFNADRSDLYFGKPISINCRREKLEAARYRGCWVFINKTAPLASWGKEVQHLDDVVLEQEFAYLVSPGHNQVEMRQVPSFAPFTFNGQDRKKTEAADRTNGR